MKTKFCEIVHFKYTNDVWVQASAIASHFEYRDPKKSICDQWSNEDKIKCHDLTSTSVNHPETSTQTSTEFPIWLLVSLGNWLMTELLQSIMDTGSFVCRTKLPCLTLTTKPEIENLTAQVFSTD